MSRSWSAVMAWRPLAYYTFIYIKFASRHLLLYVVYTCRKSFNFIDAFDCYKQKCELAPFNLAHPIFTSDKRGGICFCPRSCVCLSVCKITQKRVHGFEWNVACRQMSGHGRTDQLLSPIRIIVRMPKPDCFLRYRMRCNAEFYHVGKIQPIATRGFTMVLLTASRRNNFLGGTCALPSSFLVLKFFFFLVLLCQLTV